jgi:hypothetical protein
VDGDAFLRLGNGNTYIDFILCICIRHYPFAVFLLDICIVDILCRDVVDKVQMVARHLPPESPTRWLHRVSTFVHDMHAHNDVHVPEPEFRAGWYSQPRFLTMILLSTTIYHI